MPDWTERYRIDRRRKVRLADWDPESTHGFSGGKKAGLKEIESLAVELEALQTLLYAERRHAVLLVLQGLDTAGKNGTIRRVFAGVDPQGVQVANFRRPTPEELEHDFLWRVHAKTPRRGEIVLFNRSHYEDVLIVRVHGLVPEKVWRRRYDAINAFEKELTEEGTTVLKFFLHIDQAEQERRLMERLADPTKRWKSTASDLEEAKRWSDYARAYEETIERTSTETAPWYIVPANRRWFRDLLVSRVLVRTFRSFRMRYPPLTDDVKALLPERVGRTPG